ncbi:hypothetical protein BH09MYX1_BH09MYX1_45320 [soil metagenome]
MQRLRLLGLACVLAIAACAKTPPPPSAPCFVVATDSDLRSKDAAKTLDEITKRVRLAPEDEALRTPTSLAYVKKILRRDSVYLFSGAATFARAGNTVEGRFLEAYLELFLGESQLVASQVLGTQAAWLGGDLRIARASVASGGAEPATERERMLVQLIRVVEEGNKVADALGVVAPAHIARGAEVVRTLTTEAPTDLRTFVLSAELRRLRGEWTEFDDAMKIAESRDRATPALCYLRAMEQLERFHRPDLGATQMRACLVRFPKLVRMQVALVLMAHGPAEGLRELDALKQMNQDHYLVSLVEPTLAADRELVRLENAGMDVAH